MVKMEGFMMPDMSGTMAGNSGMVRRGTFGGEER